MGEGNRSKLSGLLSNPVTDVTADTHARNLQTRCCIVGGGPAGMMLGLLLARAGIAVTVLEKHPDFLRDFRGDTVHPSTLEILDQIGLLDAFEAIPHRRESEIVARFADGFHALIEMRGLKPFPYISIAPQWDFLDMLVSEGQKLPTFELRMRCEASGLVRDDANRVTGVRARDPDGELTIHADLVVACDGRSSTLRADAGLPVRDFGAPMDVLWFRLPRRPADIDNTFAVPASGQMMVMLNRNDYWQSAFLIRKGSGSQLRERSVAEFRERVASLLPFEAERADGLTDWNQVKMLEVKVDRLQRWHLPGLLLIGDAAHAMSPIGGVGINLAIQDAVAVANLVGPALRDGGPIAEKLLARV